MKYRYRTDEEMKDSGIEWLGKIPKEWNIIKGKYIFYNKKIKNSGNISDIISLTLNGVIDRDIENLEGLQPDSFDSYQEFYKGNLVFKLIDLENKKTSRVGIVHKNGLMSPAYIRLQEKKKVYNKYYYYNYLDYYNKYIYNILGNVGVRSAMSPEDLLNMYIIKINYPEQQKIADFLDEKTAKIDSIIEKLNLQIEKLKEAKQSLISEAVTGKIEVLD
jgi:type I restriction enzyme S subunit